MEYMHEAYPALMVDIQVDTSTALRTQLSSHQIDLAFLLGPMDEPRVENIRSVPLSAGLDRRPAADAWDARRFP